IDAPRHTLVEALVPHLDNSNETIRGMVRRLLRGYEDRSATRGPDYSAYEAIIEADVRAGREPQRSLVRFMYEGEPGTAMVSMMRAYQLPDQKEIKPILWGEHSVSELLWKRRFGFAPAAAGDAAVTQELEKLSRHERWWVRLYCARIVGDHAELGTREMFDRLANDSDAMVRQAALRANAVPEGTTRP